jgi:hypothetical protein
MRINELVPKPAAPLLTLIKLKHLLPSFLSSSPNFPVGSTRHKHIQIAVAMEIFELSEICPIMRQIGLFFWLRFE